MNKLPSTRAEAIKQGSKRYFTGKPCKCGHVAERRVTVADCVECLNEDRKRWKQRNREKVRAADREYNVRNRANRQHHKAKMRADKLNRVPAWADMEAIEAIYAKSCLWTEQSDEVFHVDHIIPLQGENVSGLHVAENLRVIPASMNMTKGNKYVVE